MTVPADEIERWIARRVGELAGVPAADVDVQAPVETAGLDSVQWLVLTADLENWLGFRFRSDPLDACPTIAALARFVADEAAAR